MRTFTTAVAVFVSAFIATIALGACSSSTPTETSAATSSSTSSKPVSSVGTWKAEGFEAKITEDEIIVYIVMDNTKSLYWTGTFAEGVGEITSDADVEALASSMMGSQDETKKFQVSPHEITFEFTIMGTMSTVYLKKA